MIVLHLLYWTTFRFWLQWSPIHITVLYVWFSSFHHLVDVEMMMGFLHSAHNFIEPRQPHKCLLAAHCVIFRVFFFDSVRGVHFFAPCIFVVADVESVYNFSDILPYELKITCMGREVVCTLSNCAQPLLGNTHMLQKAKQNQLCSCRLTKIQVYKCNELYLNRIKNWFSLAHNFSFYYQKHTDGKVHLHDGIHCNYKWQLITFSWTSLLPSLEHHWYLLLSITAIPSLEHHCYLLLNITANLPYSTDTCTVKNRIPYYHVV